MAQARMNKANRIVALVLALIWITGGGLGIALGLRHNKRLFVLAGGTAIFYGLIWLRVACEGRKLSISEALRPWRAS